VSGIDKEPNVLNMDGFVETQRPADFFALLDGRIPACHGDNRVTRVAEDDKTQHGCNQENDDALDEPVGNVSGHKNCLPGLCSVMNQPRHGLG
jgi:hypothetical protein